jgi:hypothetical protein
MQMARPLAIGVCLFFSAGGLLAQNYYMATQQAKKAVGQNDAEQQRIQGEANGGVAGAAGAPAAAQPINPALQATLKNVAGLQTDLAGLAAAGDKAGTEQKNALLNDLSQAAQGPKASTDSVKKLADDLQAAVAGKTKLTAPQQTKLARDVHALFNSAHLSPAQQQALLTDVQKVLTSGGAEQNASGDVVADLKAVVDQTK